jgi:hypothetical protein
MMSNASISVQPVRGDLQPFADLKITNKDGSTSVLTASFRSSTLAVLAGAMIDQDIDKVEFLNGLVQVAIIKDKTYKTKTGKIIGE